MSARTASSALLLVVTCVRLSLGQDQALFPYQTQVTNPYVTQLLRIERVVSTHVKSVAHTVLAYPTCTTTAPGVLPCASHHTRLPPLLRPSSVSLQQMTQEVSTEGGESSTTHNVMEVVLPSCDCGLARVEEGWGSRGYRSPRQMKEEAVTVRTTITNTVVETLTSTDTSTTVSITYGGCVPADALSTIACGLP